jgi:hypothetical protein
MKVRGYDISIFVSYYLVKVRRQEEKPRLLPEMPTSGLLMRKYSPPDTLSAV